MALSRDLNRQAVVERVCRKLWLKHAHNDGYSQDWMGERAFGDAVCELLDNIKYEKLRFVEDR